MILRAAVTALALLGLPAHADACTRDGPVCEVPLGAYRVALPDAGGAVPAVLFLHGAGGTGRGVLGMTGTVEAITARGYAVIAPDGLPWRSGRTGGIWTFRRDLVRETPRDEAAFFAEVIADAADRHGIDPDRVILAGFSAGAFMVTYLACETPGAFPAYAPVSGGFWRPHPEACAGPVRLFHTHGWRDGTVPLEGRPLRGGQWLQGDIFEGLALFRAANGCARPDPTGHATTGEFLRRSWDCDEGSALEFALFPGGHGVPAGWAEMMLDWYEALPDAAATPG
ncbi:alpha/beta hydrolase family esterase [Jannaschia marina]|uniref:alpha/beta hydrolase family esterase n=1 Tax=Jannaschia marina TaxID=2741674 RepID=UPI0015CA6E92|nr:PHB depolymerase family esterase [Jannaschia marina]